jgi:hypothetical protein
MAWIPHAFVHDEHLPLKSVLAAGGAAEIFRDSGAGELLDLQVDARGRSVLL